MKIYRYEVRGGCSNYPLNDFSMSCQDDSFLHMWFTNVCGLIKI